MSVDDFISAQQQFIVESGFNDYLPTLWVETSKQVNVNVLTDAPEGDELESVARDWAKQMARKCDYYLAFKLDDLHLKVVSQVGAVTRDQIVAVKAV